MDQRVQRWIESSGLRVAVPNREQSREMEHARYIQHSGICTQSAAISRTEQRLRVELTVMAEPLSPLSKEETIAIVRRTYQEVIDTLLFISDEMEMQCLPTRDGASALRMAAGLLALTKELT